MRVAVIGAKGMLGRELCELFSNTDDVYALDIDTIDITDRAATLKTLQEIAPHLVINSAVMVDVDACEKDPHTAWRVNAVGAQNVARAAAHTDATLIYISTDYVFNGASQSDYAEYHPVDPINHYGTSKLYGEILSRNLCQKCYIVRSSWLFGNSPLSYVARILKAAETGSVEMPQDQLEAPTYTRHLATALRALSRRECYGTYHFTGGEGCTRTVFAQEVLRAAAIETPVRVLPHNVAQQKRVALRPARVVLDCTLYSTVVAPPPSWREGIQEYFSTNPYRPQS